jgi:cytochrome c-type biogenesis protein CcmE
MGQQKAKFVLGALIILGTLAWLGFGGYQESKTYYVTLPELRATGEDAYSMRLRVAGNVLPGSIRRLEGRVLFTLYQEGNRLDVIYTGTEPLPDTLVDDAQAVVTGRYGRDDVFTAQQVQAKCASKYEALPPGTHPANPATEESAY